MQPLTNFAEANAYLRQFHDNVQTEYTLDNMLALMEFLGNPQNKFKAIHVAGTSGKTSTAYYAAALLAAAGRKTGLTVSPHVDELNERIQVNGQPISETEFCLGLTDFARLIEQAPVKPSWFEVVVAFAYWYFAREGVEYAVVEVGLGGQKDSTNVISRPDKVCVITDIGYDHMKVLGDSLREIAAQKAGIIQPGNVTFTYNQAPEIKTEFQKRAGDRLHVIEEAPNPNQDIPNYQSRNWFLAHQVYGFIARRDNLPNLTSKALERSRHLLIPGRMNVLGLNNKKIIMDGAHNAQKMNAFVGSFCKLFPGVKPAVLLAMREGKEYEELIPVLAGLASRIVTTTFESNQDLPIKSMPADDLAAAFEGNVPVRSISDQKRAFKELIDGPEPVCVVTGSLYLLGQIRNNEHLV